MAGIRQPTALLEAKGKKHLTKAEIEERKNKEISAPADKVTPPKYLTKEQKKIFNKLKKQLLAINLISNLDVDALSRFIIAQTKYVEVTEKIAQEPLTVTKEIEEKDMNGDVIGKYELEIVNPLVDKLLIIQDRLFKQCRQGAADFGLTITSRCRLVVPKAKEEKTNKFNKFLDKKGKA